jgi:hypothetical protein
MEEGRILRRRAHSLSFICSSEEEVLSDQEEVLCIGRGELGHLFLWRETFSFRFSLFMVIISAWRRAHELRGLAATW